jgi:hypothetical protein
MALSATIASCFGVVKYCKISNLKHQTTNKSQIPIPNDQKKFGILNFGHCDLFDVCGLLFGILGGPVFQQTTEKRRNH